MKKKLIRADSLLEQIESPYVEYPVMIGIRTAIKEMIDEAPEVNAIPIEWLKRYRDTRINKYGPLFEEFGTMLERWEEENGKR